MKQYRAHLLVACVLALVLLSGAHRALQNIIEDTRFGWFPRQPSGDVVLVAIDPYSIERIGVWPWPRSLHGELIERLEGAGATDIAFDVDFSSPSNAVSDRALSDALRRAGGSVILPSFAQVTGRGKARTTHVNRPLPEFAQQSWPAVVNVAVEPDGLVHRYAFGEEFDGSVLPSVGALLSGRQTPREGSYLIDFSISDASLPIVSYADVLHGDAAALARLKDKKVIVGATAIELGDHFSVPNGRVIAGVLLQTLAAESILQGRALGEASIVVSLGIVALIMLLMGVVWRRWSAGVRLVVLLGAALAIEGAAALVQAHWPIVADTSLCHVAIIAYLGALALDEIDFLGLLGMIAERRFQQIAMSLGDGLVCTDSNGLITLWNRGATAIFNYKSRDMIGKRLDLVFAADRHAAFSVLDLPQEILSAPGGKMMELDGRKRNGDTFPMEACFFGWQGTDGFQRGAVLRDISVRKREAERIRYLAEHDTLTGLANRNALHARLCADIAHLHDRQQKVALVVLGIDRFKHINDTLGQACGDQVLNAVAEHLSTLVKDGGMIARLGGDEFAIVLGGTDAASRADALSTRALAILNKTPLSIGTRELAISISMGIALYPDDCGTAEELLAGADLALYRAKATGRGRRVLFDRAIRNELEARVRLEAELKLAAERSEFELFYQPQATLPDGKLVGAEALIRWRHPERGLLPPGEFIEVANASPIQASLARWVIESACRQGRRWEQQGHAVRIGVNLAPAQLQAGDVVARIETVLRETGLSPALLELEVTENILLEDDEKARATFRRIQDLGVSIAFDDFGTGYASLSYLKKFPLDRLKIDKSFVSEATVDSDAAAIVSSTITLARLLGLAVIAEGIEDRATADLLACMGCEEGQGYFFGRPMPAQEFEERFLSKEAVSASAPPAASAA